MRIECRCECMRKFFKLLINVQKFADPPLLKWEGLSLTVRGWIKLDQTMAFPSECVGPVCDSFLDRTSKLITVLRCCDMADKTCVAKLKYSVLTLQLLVEKNSDALSYISLLTPNSNSLFLSDVFKFILQGTMLKLLIICIRA